jgi:hypothetical protein
MTQTSQDAIIVAGFPQAVRFGGRTVDLATEENTSQQVKPVLPHSDHPRRPNQDRSERFAP